MTFERSDVGIHLPSRSIYEIGLFDSNFDPGNATSPQHFSDRAGFQQHILAQEAYDADTSVTPGEHAHVRKQVQDNVYAPMDDVRIAWGLNRSTTQSFKSMDLLEKANVLAFNGGNPDFLL